MSEATSGVADRTSGDIGAPFEREIGVPFEREIGVPWEREGLLCADIAGLEVDEEVARAEEGLWVGSTKQVWV